MYSSGVIFLWMQNSNPKKIVMLFFYYVVVE